jgi:hypothetical protein
LIVPPGMEGRDIALLRLIAMGNAEAGEERERMIRKKARKARKKLLKVDFIMVVVVVRRLGGGV